MNIELKDSICNQDNTIMWVNPILKTKLGKLLLAIGFIPIILAIFLIDWKQIYYNNKIVSVIQICLFLISAIYVLVNYIISKINMYRTEDENKTVDYEYYREILEETSSGVLSFVYNKKINYKDILISTLIKLEKEKNIKLDYNNKCIKILLNKSDNKLCEYEKYILKLLQNASRNETIPFSILNQIISNENFKINVIELVKKSSKEKGYFKTKSSSSNILVYIILINFGITMFTMISSNNVCVICFINTLMMWLLCYIINKKIYIRTKKGRLLGDQLNGLKNFLTKYSIIHDRQVKDVTLWDYYIIYAIIFNLKGKLNTDVNILYNTLIEKI